MWSWWEMCTAPWTLGLVLSSTSTTQANRCPASPNIAVGLTTASYWYLQSIAAGISNSNFLQAALIMSLNSSSSGSMKYIPLNCLVTGIIDFWFLDDPSLFWFLFTCNGHTRPHIWPYVVKTRSILFSCKSHLGPCVPIKWPFVQ